MNDSHRHLKRKLLNKVKLPDEVGDYIESAPKTEITKKLKKEKNQTGMLSHANEYITGFNFNTVFIPTVDPIPVYFDMALRQLSYLNDRKKSVIDVARSNISIDEMVKELFYFFGCSSIFVSQLTSSIECFINLNIKSSTTYNRQKDGKKLHGEECSWVPLKEKIEFLIVNLTDKLEFQDLYPNDITKLKKLVDYRNKCVHPRVDKEFAMDNYEDIFNTCLSFNYNSSIESAKNFINYYSGENIIEECFCHKK